MEPAKPPVQPKQEKDDKYAEGLAKMAAIDYQMEQSKKPKTEHFISNKKLVYIGVSIAISIIFTLAYNFSTRGDKSESVDGAQKIEDLLKSTQEIKNIETE